MILDKLNKISLKNNMKKNSVKIMIYYVEAIQNVGKLTWVWMKFFNFIR